MDISVLGIDLGKNVCSVVGLDASGAVVIRRKVRRETLIALAEKLPPCVVGMEACCGAHHLGRVLAAHGHDVRLMSPEYVRPLHQGAEERRSRRRGDRGGGDPADDALCRTKRARTSSTCRRFIDRETGWLASGRLRSNGRPPESPHLDVGSSRRVIDPSKQFPNASLSRWDSAHHCNLFRCAAKG
jgi:hypothetical protein